LFCEIRIGDNFDTSIIISTMLKSFDFFRKIQTDQELTSATGGIFTVIALIVSMISQRSQAFLSSFRCRISTNKSTTPSWQSRTTTPNIYPCASISLSTNFPAQVRHLLTQDWEYNLKMSWSTSKAA